MVSPSGGTVRLSRRASTPVQRLSSPVQAEERPKHRSTTPMDARVWSIHFLQRQDARNQSWFRYLDSVKVAC